ncbi:MAG: stage V sporulation protein SpoVM [Clostridia bacterium]|nr:stage V sporulation protein SpoVM [Clostridia bacterium]
MDYPSVKVRGGIFLKVVVIKNPKIIGSLLRLMFGIKKEG